MTGTGSVTARFTVSSRHGAMLRKEGLLAKAAPKHRAAVDGHAPEEPGRPFGIIGWGWRSRSWIESYPAEALPKSGGVNATVVVTMTLETLLGGLKAAQLDTGENASAPARPVGWRAEAGIIPAVLDGKSQVLDLGRKRRFHTTAQRIAPRPSNKHGCTADGCDWPPGLCHAHHKSSVEQGRRHEPHQRTTSMSETPRSRPPHDRLPPNRTLGRRLEAERGETSKG